MPEAHRWVRPLCTFAPSAGVLGLLRFLAGLGLGGCLPTAITLVTEYAPRGRNGGPTTLIMESGRPTRSSDR